MTTFERIVIMDHSSYDECTTMEIPLTSYDYGKCAKMFIDSHEELKSSNIRTLTINEIIVITSIQESFNSLLFAMKLSELTTINSFSIGNVQYLYFPEGTPFSVTWDSNQLIKKFYNEEIGKYSFIGCPMNSITVTMTENTHEEFAKILIEHVDKISIEKGYVVKDYKGLAIHLKSLKIIGSDLFPFSINRLITNVRKNRPCFYFGVDDIVYV